MVNMSLKQQLLQQRFLIFLFDIFGSRGSIDVYICTSKVHINYRVTNLKSSTRLTHLKLPEWELRITV